MQIRARKKSAKHALFPFPACFSRIRDVLLFIPFLNGINQSETSSIMVFILFVSVLFLLAFVFLDMSHEVLKKQIRRISAKKTDDASPRELDYPFFRLAGSGSSRAPWQRYSRTEIQIADRDDFIKKIAPEHFDKFITQERILRLLLGASFFVLALDVLAVAVHIIRHWH